MMGNVRCSEERCSDVTPRYGARDKCDRTRSWRASLDEGSISPLPTKKPSQRGLFCLWESGTDLLSRGIPRTIIGAAPFHGPVRDGKAWFQSALGTRHSSEFHRSPHGGDETSSSKEAGWDCQA